MCCTGSLGWVRHAFSSAALSAFLLALAPPVAASLSTVTVVWDPSGDPTVIGYRIYYGAASGYYTNLIEAGNATSAPVPGSSAFLYLPLEVLSASKPNGAAYENPVPEMGRVVVVGDAPLLERNAVGHTNLSLTFFGKVGASYQLQEATVPGAQGAWQPLLNYTQTNIQQALTVDPSQPLMFYRLLQS